MRGSSGATFEEGDDFITKMDAPHTGTRVRDQGVWLTQFGDCNPLPQVFQVLWNGYEMEKLQSRDLPITVLETYHRCDLILELLQGEIWVYKPMQRTLYERNFNTREHKLYIKRLLRDVDRREWWPYLRSYVDTIDWCTLKTAVTHGDPIIDNLLWRRGVSNAITDAVLIDPIPSCPALPDLAAVDVGRVIQSAVGYEAIRYLSRDVARPDVDDAVTHVLNTWMDEKFDVNEARAAIHFAIIHMLRGVRTALRVAPDRAKDLAYLTYALIEEAEEWMQ